MYGEGLTCQKQFSIVAGHSGCIGEAKPMVTRDVGKKQVVFARNVLTIAPFINFEKEYPKWHEQTAQRLNPPLTPARVAQPDVLDCWRTSHELKHPSITRVDICWSIAITALTLAVIMI